MATQNKELSENNENNEVVDDSTDGPSKRDSILLITDSYADLAMCLTDQCKLSGSRHNSVSNNQDSAISGASTSCSLFDNSTSSPNSTITEQDPEINNHQDVSDDSNKLMDHVPNDCAAATTSPATALTITNNVNDSHNANKVQLSTDHSGSAASNVGRSVCDKEAQSSSDIDDEDDIDYLHDETWKQHRKHFFVLSTAGKPIYSYHGSEDKLVTLMGVLQALVAVVQDNNDALRCMRAGNHQFVFLVREHLTLVAVVQDPCHFIQHILVELNYVYNQIISVLTYSQLKRIFDQRHNYDLRRLLTGAERFMDNLIDMMQVDAGFLLGAVRCLPLASSTRDIITQSIVQHCKVKDLVFAIMLAGNQLVSLVRLKKFQLHPMDLHLIINLVNSSESFKGSESWTPICLPNLNDAGYLHAHISYVDENCQCCLLLLSVDRDMFFTLSDCKAKIVQRLIKYRCLRSMLDSIQRTRYTLSDVGIADLRHFLYKSKNTSQYTSPAYQAPYDTDDERQRLFSLYQYLHHRIHSPARPLKLLFHVGPYEALLGWVTTTFELYTVFSPLVTKPMAINSVDKLLKWIGTKDDSFFILKSATF